MLARVSQTALRGSGAGSQTAGLVGGRCGGVVRPARGLRVQVAAKKGALSELLKLSKGTADEKTRELMKPYPVSPMLEVPDHIVKPDWYATGIMPEMTTSPETHNAQGIEKMRRVCKLASTILQEAGAMCVEGTTTDEIDRFVHNSSIEAGAYPSPLNYGKFPKSVCTSVNEVLCHGIPDARPLKNGDIVNIDVTVFLDGHHGDTSAMFLVGDVDPEAKRLCEIAKLCRDEAIKQCGPGVPYKQIGRTINDLADEHKLGLNRDFIGHGVGKVFHAAPQVFHHRNRHPGSMQVGQTFTIEPILCLGRPRWKLWKDDWTASARDNSLAAQWEHTVLITENGHEILTAWD